MNSRRLKNASSWRMLRSTIYIGALLLLSFFAKDNLIAEAKHALSFDSPPDSKTLRAMGTIEVVFSPNRGATEAIIKLLNEAQKSILVEAYSFTSKDIAEALLDAKKRKVSVQLILDKSQISQRYSSSTFFINQGFDLKIDVKHAIFHNKVMIIDDKTVITGSFNFTKAAETKNAENLLIIRDNPQLANLYKENFWFHWKQSISARELENQKRAGVPSARLLKDKVE